MKLKEVSVYRFRDRIPGRIGDVDPTGTTAVFETSVDDYAEVRVDGELARAALYRMRLNAPGVRP
jgi:hypothetical protein